MASSPEPRHAVLYAAKSTADKAGSIPTQLADGRALAEAEGLEVAGREFYDEAASAFKGNRGSGLASAMEACEALAAESGEAVLIVQHSDRLARGDGRQAAHLVEYFLWAIKSNVRIRSVQDNQTFGDLLYTVVTGQRNHEDSARKSKSVRDGLARRKARGKPVGRIPFGYMAEAITEDGQPTTRRVPDPAKLPVLEAMFSRVESGMSFGDVQRWLNAAGRPAPRSDRWSTRTVSRILQDPVYAGRGAYPKIIDPDRFDRIQKNLKRLDPVAVARRSGGRRPVDDSYFLRGIGRCLTCGATLYTRRQAAGRMYVCANRRLGTDLCDATPIPAGLLEGHVLRHLSSFIANIEDWLVKQTEESKSEHAAREAAAERARDHVGTLERQHEKLVAGFADLGDLDDAQAKAALDVVAHAKAELAQAQEALRQAESVVSEWAGPPDVDAALDFYNQLVDFVTGQVREARGTIELNRALAQVLTGLWAEVETDRERLLVEFELRGHDWRNETTALGTPVPPELAHRPTLPPANMRYEPFEPLRGMDGELPTSPDVDEQWDAAVRAARPLQFVTPDGKPRRDIPGPTPSCTTTR